MIQQVPHEWVHSLAKLWIELLYLPSAETPWVLLTAPSPSFLLLLLFLPLLLSFQPQDFFLPFLNEKKKTTHSALVEKFMKWLAHSTLQTRPTFCLLTSKVPLFPLTYLIVFLSLSLSLTSNGSCPQFKGFNTLSPTSTPFFSPLLLEMAKDTVTHTPLCLIICQICHNKNTLNTSVEYFIQNWNSLQVNLLKGWIRCFYFFLYYYLWLLQQQKVTLKLLCRLFLIVPCCFVHMFCILLIIWNALYIYTYTSHLTLLKWGQNSINYWLKQGCYSNTLSGLHSITKSIHAFSLLNKQKKHNNKNWKVDYDGYNFGSL